MTVHLANPQQFTSWFRQVMSEDLEILLSELDGAVADTADYIQRFIETVPSGIVPGKPNRVLTGLMRDSIDYDEIKKSGKNSYRLSVGWTGNREKYFLYQEYGTGDRSGGMANITPMYALTAAKVFLDQQIKSIPGVDK